MLALSMSFNFTDTLNLLLLWEQLSWEKLGQSLLAPFAFPFDPAKRIFWLFLLSALVLACITVSWHKQQFDLRAQLRSLFNFRYWFHSSSRTDFALIFTNSVLKITILIPIIGSHLAMTMWVSSTLRSTFGDIDPIQINWWLVGILYTGTFFLLEDLSRFALHRLMHKSSFLWRFHSVHHSATNLTPFTLLRVHPVEMVIYYLRGLLVFGGVSGLFIYLFRNNVHGFDVLGVDLLGFLFNFLGANLRHTPIWLSFGFFERWFISPAQHQIHHSSAMEHRDKNFGTCLAVWDRWFGSWVGAGAPKNLTYGVGPNAVV